MFIHLILSSHYKRNLKLYHLYLETKGFEDLIYSVYNGVLKELKEKKLNRIKDSTDNQWCVCFCYV